MRFGGRPLPEYDVGACSTHAYVLCFLYFEPPLLCVLALGRSIASCCHHCWRTRERSGLPVWMIFLWTSPCRRYGKTWQREGLTCGRKGRIDGVAFFCSVFVLARWRLCLFCIFYFFQASSWGAVLEHVWALVPLQSRGKMK